MLCIGNTPLLGGPPAYIFIHILCWQFELYLGNRSVQPVLPQKTKPAKKQKNMVGKLKNPLVCSQFVGKTLANIRSLIRRVRQVTKSTAITFSNFQLSLPRPRAGHPQKPTTPPSGYSSCGTSSTQPLWSAVQCGGK